MFLGSSSGKIRSMRFPLGAITSGAQGKPAAQNSESKDGEGQDGVNAIVASNGDFQEHQGHSAPVTKLRVSYDDQYLFSTSEDGCLYVYKISDKDGRGAKREREIIFADEVTNT